MPDLKLLQADMAQILERDRALEIEGGAEPPEHVRNERMQLHDRALKVKQLIDDEEEHIRRADMDALNDWATKPRPYSPPKAVNADDDGRRVLMGAGWEIRGGMIHVPTSSGELYPLFGEEVLFGPLPEGSKTAEQRQFYQLARATAQPTYRAAYEKFLRTSVNFRSEAMALAQMTIEEQRALSEGLDTAGGYLVPPDMQAEMLQRTAQTAVIRRLARVVNTSRDRVSFPRVEAHATSGSIYSSGFVGSWVGETPAFTDTDPSFGTFEISLKKLRVATKLSNDFVADSATPILGWLAGNGAENMALVEDAGFINGNGTPLQPLGLLNEAGITTVDVEGSTANSIIGTTTLATNTGKKMIDLMYALPAQYAENASWLMSRNSEGKVRVLPDGTGAFMWPQRNGSAFARVPRDISGYPIYNSDFMPNDGTDANKVFAFGDFSNFIIAQRASLSTVLLRERFADTDQTGIIIFERIGGGVWNPDAFRFGIV